MKVIQLDGGIGRVLTAEPAIRLLSKEHRVTVLTNWPEIFLGNPDIYKLYRLDREYLFDDVIKHGEFVCPEPYHDFSYYNQRHHLIESFNFLLNGVVSKDRPKLYFHCNETAEAKKIVDEARSRGKVVALQAFGSSVNQDLVDHSYRSLPKKAVEYIISNLKSQGYVFINCSSIAVDDPSILNLNTSTRLLMAVASMCDRVITIDSLLAHVGYAFDIKGLQFLGGTYAENVGYIGQYVTVTREGYPKSYNPNRFSGFVELNKGAMDFTEKELDDALGQFIAI